MVPAGTAPAGVSFWDRTSGVRDEQDGGNYAGESRGRISAGSWMSRGHRVPPALPARASFSPG